MAPKESKKCALYSRRSPSNLKNTLDQVKKMSLKYGEDVEVPFEASKFSMVMGLANIGVEVLLKARDDEIIILRKKIEELKAFRKTRDHELVSLKNKSVDFEMQNDQFVKEEECDGMNMRDDNFLTSTSDFVNLISEFGDIQKNKEGEDKEDKEDDESKGQKEEDEHEEEKEERGMEECKEDDENEEDNENDEGEKQEGDNEKEKEEEESLKKQEKYGQKDVTIPLLFEMFKIEMIGKKKRERKDELEIYCGRKDYNGRDEIVDIDNEILDNYMPDDVLGLEVEHELYRGRKDYKARDEIAEVDREMLDNFMSKDDLGCICGLLFGEKHSGDTIDFYMITLSRHSTSIGYEICYISTIVQRLSLVPPSSRHNP
ncbi:PREDICTED: myb-like protein X [Erythranthe guttata]|uniref:myb-like protein X n=1 Tax=Erythranthe guttata TaxID=4155 RepID=UPI00064D9011|nr:PREDICTED: myb-like protein X [Erythranthe guttata]|eukprot:XP_012833692.1 PREDICTED: myb-like protein X [Erythranthe guttata]